MPELIHINDAWSRQPWFSTGGTRAKKYLQSPDGKFYYFKRSQLKPGRDYHYEFWNEVIAYELGTMLGFTMLRYDVAIDGSVMGCICESMINTEEEELIEGVKYLQAFSPQYDPAKKEQQSWYTFDMICNALKAAKLQDFIEPVIGIIIFDALIGNSDRHQENWAIIEKQKLITEVIKEIEDDKDFEKQSKFSKWLILIAKKLHVSALKNYASRKEIPKLLFRTDYTFAPIYDSGSSLGRELTDERVMLLLSNERELESYINRGTSEIHWNGKKLNHFALIREIAGTSYMNFVSTTINRVTKLFDAEKLWFILHEIDQKLPEPYHSYKIPQHRKELIFKIITLRFERLKELIHEGI